MGDFLLYTVTLIFHVQTVRYLERTLLYLGYSIIPIVDLKAVQVLGGIIRHTESLIMTGSLIDTVIPSSTSMISRISMVNFGDSKLSNLGIFKSQRGNWTRIGKAVLPFRYLHCFYVALHKP